MTVLNSINVTFFDKYQNIVATRTYLHNFFTADRRIIMDGAKGWAKEELKKLNAVSFSVGPRNVVEK